MRGQGEPDGRASGPGAGVDRERLHRLLGGEDTRWLVDRVRSRIARGRALTGTVTLARATDGQRLAVQRLLGRRPAPGRSLGVRLEAVDAVLRRSEVCPRGLAAAVEELRGPVAVRADAAAAEAREWDRVFAPLEGVCAPRKELADWCGRLRASGLARRLLGEPAGAFPELRRLAAVVGQLPAAGEGLAVFAARVCGDAHALDHGRPLGTLALSAARALAGLDSAANADSGAEGRREAWAAVGLLQDELSATVLATGLPGDTGTATGRALAEMRNAGQPAVLTLRQLVRDPVRPLDGAESVHLCENPAVVAAAADRLGPACPPLVCTRGQPGAAVLVLLRSLCRDGAMLRYHGDFDWGGIRIANALLRRLNWHPWRYSAADYRSAVGAGVSGELSGEPVAADWDAELAPAMSGAGRRVEEEAVLDVLLADLTQRAD
ncbi:TIGR02679 family protein [Streptomonospora wellingtoniae]|uniref:TIGR02679 family protein n=1 Tax=Streptomonospora wellingtoniae TaxID=3075544 RepID=A0ABU2KZW7_9ACTN|nr:TIGR02679 family protein [Streptomonospora sp. DSM 45055]MDT0304851.1 TIGR02679 family protein [Streptomonospora sp. DSM 45055]